MRFVGDTEAAVAATHGPEAGLPAVDIHSTQTLPEQEMDGSSPSKLLAEAKERIGSLPLCEAAEHYPIEAWRVWMSSHPVNYTEDSEEFLQRLKNFLRNAELIRDYNAEHSKEPSKRLGLNSTADGIPMDEMRSSVPAGPYPEDLPESSAECLRMMADGDAPASAQARLPGSSPLKLLEEARDRIGSLPLYEAAERYPIEAWMVWSSSHPVNYNKDSKEFHERLKIFQRNAEIVRTHSAKHSKEPDKFLGLNNGADKVLWDEMKAGVPSGPYRGGIPEPYSEYKRMQAA